MKKIVGIYNFGSVAGDNSSIKNMVLQNNELEGIFLLKICSSFSFSKIADQHNHLLNPN